MKDLTAGLILVTCVTFLLRHGESSVPAPAAFLLLALLALLFDLALLFRGGEKLSRVSIIASLALAFLGPRGLLAAVITGLAGGLAIALSGREKRKVAGDLVRSLSPLGAAALLYLPLPHPLPVLSCSVGFLFSSLLLEPRRYRLRPTFLTLFCTPWAAYALAHQVRAEPWALLLAVPLFVALSRGEDSSFPLLVKLKSALRISQQRFQERTQKAQRLEILFKAANLMSRTLEPEKLRGALRQAVDSTGLGQSRVFLPGEPPKGQTFIPLLDGRATLALTREPDPEQRELLEILARIFATCWENSELHQQVRDALEETRRSQAMLVESSRMAAMGLVAAGVAHEVNTPLGAIQLSAELAEAHLARDPSKVKTHLAAILRATERAQKAVARTLYYAKPLGADAAETFAPAEVIEDALELLSHRIARSQVTVEKDLDTGVLLTGERQAFFSLVFNLILNAADASVHAGVGKVWVRCGVHQKTVVVEVEDSGPGVPAELQSDIFEPFFTTKPSGEGTGLGLHLARQATDLFKGRLFLATRRGRGALFRAEFPHSPSH